MSIDVFISHHTKSSLPITEAICNSLEANAIRCWYAPRDTQGSYARSIVTAINECRIFIIVLNRESSFSEDVLNEMNVAFDRLRAGENITLLPFQVSADEISSDAKYYIGRMHWIDAITPPMEDRIQELTSRILEMIGHETRPKSAPPKGSLQSSSVLPNYNFIGRDDELARIESVLNSDRIAFVYGLGGSGKTELAKRYIQKHSSACDTIIFAQYESSLQDLLVSNQVFNLEGFQRRNRNGEPESDAQFALRKLTEIKRLTTPDTLIVLDNFDTLEDPLLEIFMDGPYKLLITTRTNFEHLGLPMVHVTALRQIEQKQLFQQYYKRALAPSDEETVDHIISLVGGHTLTIELIAKLMASKRIKPAFMFEQLSQAGVSSALKGNVTHGFQHADSVYAHVKALFQTENLPHRERDILMNLSLLPTEGVSVDDFISWCEIDDCEPIDSLINRSWILYDIKKDFMSLHPVISDIVRSECKVSLQTCKTMISHLVDWFRGCWNMHAQERTHCGEIAKSLYFKNSFNDICNFDTYQVFFKVFKTLDYHDLCDRLAGDMRRVLGNAPSVELGWYYYEIGDISINRMQYDKAVENLEKAIEVFSQAKPNSYELAYVTKHLAHTCHAIYEHKDQSVDWLEKARKLLEESGRIFPTCVEDCSPQMGSQLYAMGLNYFYFGEYEKALEYEQKSFDIFMELNGEINSDTNAPMRILAKVYSKLGRYDDAIHNKYSFPVLIVRPKAMLSKNYINVPNEIENGFLNLYGAYCTFQQDVSSYTVPSQNQSRASDITVRSTGKTFLVDMAGIWENCYPDRSFGMFKKDFFERKFRAGQNSYTVSPRVRVEMRYTDDFSTIYCKSKLVIEAITKVFEKYKHGEAKQFSLRQFELDLAEILEEKVVSHDKIAMLLDIFTENVDEGAIYSQSRNCIRVLRSRKMPGTDETGYFVSSASYARLPNFFVHQIEQCKVNSADNSFFRFYPLTQNKQIEIMPLLRFLELLGLATYEIRGGEKAQVFIRINDPEKIEYLVSSGKYTNTVLQNIQERHQNNERLLSAFFAADMSDEERWELIEQYFLGNEDYVRHVLNIEN